MEDNANLSKAFVENQKKLYQGVFESRKIKGLWIIAQGLVYDTFCPDKHTCSNKEILEKIRKMNDKILNLQIPDNRATLKRQTLIRLNLYLTG